MTSRLRAGGCVLVCSFSGGSRVGGVTGGLTGQRGCLVVNIGTGLGCMSGGCCLRNPTRFLDLMGGTRLVLAASFRTLTFKLVFGQHLNVFGHGVKVGAHVESVLRLINLSSRLLRDTGGSDLTRFSVGCGTISGRVRGRIGHSRDFLVGDVGSGCGGRWMV